MSSAVVRLGIVESNVTGFEPDLAGHGRHNSLVSHSIISTEYQASHISVVER
jgi:hypothetical protein